MKEKFPTDAPLEHGVGEDGIAILLEMMNPYPANRITVSDALSHLWTCLQKLNTIISNRLNINKSPCQTAKDQSLEERSPIVDSAAQVNSTLPFNIDGGDGETDQPITYP